MGFLVENWMMGEGLHLKGCELLVFAYAYSYHRKGKNMFISEGNLGELICYSRRNVGAALDRLCEKQLLLRTGKKQPGHQTYIYSVNEEQLRNNFTSSCEKTSQLDVKKLHTEVGKKVTATCNLSSHNKEKDKPIHNPLDRDDTSLTTTTRVKTQNRYGTSDQRHAVLTVGHSEDFAEPDRV